MKTIIAAAILGCTAVGSACAQTAYPERPVRLISAFAPGGATDVAARALAARLSQTWKQQVIVENRPGAGGNIGGDAVAKAEPDGYTLLMASPAEVTINQHVFPKMQYDPMKDLVPVSKVATAPLVLLVHPKVPVRSVEELIRHARDQAGRLNYASSGTGGPQHLAAEQFKMQQGLQITHVPYKGGAPAIADLLGGQVDMFFSGMPPALSQVKAGKLRALAVTSAARSRQLPDVPTMVEAGVPGFIVENWQGVFAPAGTPQAVIEKLNRDINAVLEDPAFAENLASQGAEPAPGTLEQFRRFVHEQDAHYAKLARDTGVRAD